MSEPRYSFDDKPRPRIAIKQVAELTREETAAADRAAGEAGFNHRPVMPPSAAMQPLPKPASNSSAQPQYTRKRRQRVGTYSGPTEQLAMRAPIQIFNRFVGFADEMELTYAQALEYLLDRVAPEGGSGTP